MSHVVLRPSFSAAGGGRVRSLAAGLAAAVLGLSLLAAGPAMAQNNAAPSARPALAQNAAAPNTSSSPAARGSNATPAKGAKTPAASPAGGSTPTPAGAAPTTPQPGTEAPAEAAPDTRGLDQEVQGLKKDVVDLNRDLFVLEEELLFPANTQVAVFLSMDVGEFFGLDSVQLKIDQKEVINYLYTPREVEALLRGGVHRLYLGNLKVGKHELVAFFSGKGPNDRDYKRGASVTFEKGIGAKYLELKINDRQRKQQPEFEIKDWE
jgi:hypothetical protein